MAASFVVYLLGNVNAREKLEKKDLELLNRLKIVKVNSEVVEEDTKTRSRPLPQERHQLGLPSFGYQEPSIIPGGRCTLRQVLEFLAKHQNDPEEHTVEAIAKTYSMKSEDVQNIVTYFRAFELFVPRENKKNVGQDVLDTLGVGNVVKPLFRSKFKNMNEEIADGSDEKINNTKETVDEKK
nr:protein NDUFAF4 homolog [Parasteatoda tepidariorum]